MVLCGVAPIAGSRNKTRQSDLIGELPRHGLGGPWHGRDGHVAEPLGNLLHACAHVSPLAARLRRPAD